MNIDWAQAKLIGEATVAIFAALAALWAFIKWPWPYLKAAGSRARGVFRAIGQMPDLHVNVAGLTNGINELRSFGEEEARKGTRRGEQIEQVIGTQAEQGKTLSLLAMTFDATVNADPNVATFRAGPDGMLIEASATYTRWTGLPFSALAGWQWINAVHEDDRERVRREWRSAIEDCRESRMRYQMVAADGTTFEVNVVATPIPPGARPCERFIGIITRED